MSGSAILKLVLISGQKRIFDGEVTEITAHTESGDVTILSDHIPYLSRIDTYVSFTRTDNKETEAHDIKDGFIYTNGEICFAVVE